MSTSARRQDRAPTFRRRRAADLRLRLTREPTAARPRAEEPLSFTKKADRGGIEAQRSSVTKVRSVCDALSARRVVATARRRAALVQRNQEEAL
ncbi:hypothetical protein MTO96_029549 [Rhipicephalus appendiculatus]